MSKSFAWGNSLAPDFVPLAGLRFEQSPKEENIENELLSGQSPRIPFEDGKLSAAAAAAGTLAVSTLRCALSLRLQAEEQEPYSRIAPLPNLPAVASDRMSSVQPIAKRAKLCSGEGEGALLPGPLMVNDLGSDLTYVRERAPQMRQCFTCSICGLLFQGLTLQEHLYTCARVYGQPGPGTRAIALHGSFLAFYYAGSLNAMLRMRMRKFEKRCREGCFRPGPKSSHMGHLACVGFDPLGKKYAYTDYLKEDAEAFVSEVHESPLAFFRNENFLKPTPKDALGTRGELFGIPGLPLASLPEKEYSVIVAAGVNYISARKMAGDAWHPPPPAVAQRLGRPGCRQLCAACAKDCLTCPYCCLKVEQDVVGVVATAGYQSPKTLAGKGAWLAVGDQAFPLRQGALAFYEASKTMHGVWSPAPPAETAVWDNWVIVEVLRLAKDPDSAN